MNFDFSDDQQAIKRTARDLLADRFKPDTVRELAEGERYDDAHWAEIAQLGWAGIAIDEAHGGQGLGTVELAILAEELGYTVAPVPFLSNAAGGIAIQHAGSDDQRERLLPAIASGEARATAGLLRGNGVAALSASGTSAATPSRSNPAVARASPEAMSGSSRSRCSPVPACWIARPPAAFDRNGTGATV